MKWFDNWFAKKCKQAWEDSRKDDEPISNMLSSVRERDDIASEPITFKMFKAKGGWAIEFRQYDRKNDRSETSLHVINNDEDLGDKISKIITYEAMLR